MKARAAEIYETLANGSMPCDEPWPKDRLAFFKQWMDEGVAPKPAAFAFLTSERAHGNRMANSSAVRCAKIL